MKKIVLILLLICIVTPITAQIKGIVTDNDKQPIPQAHIALYVADSVLVGETLSNLKGEFELKVKQKPEAHYFLTISCVGFSQQTLRMNDIPDKVDLGFIIMQNVQIDEVVVTAERFVVKTDRQLIYPPKKIIENSTSGFDLLSQLMLPGLNVDITKSTISKFGGGSVPIYINDKKAMQEDVIALRPDEIIRVEYIDEPGVRFANDAAEAVINFVVKRRISGLIVGINTTNAVTTGEGNNFVYMRYNNKLSEFGINYSMNYGIMNKRHTDENNKYILADNTTHYIIKEGIDTFLKYMQHRVQLTYSLSIPDKYVFEVNLRGLFYDSPNRGNRQRVSETGKEPYYALTEPTEKYRSPVIDVFYNVNLANEQTITANVVGTLTDTKYGYSYKTYADDFFSDPLQKYGYDTNGKKYSLIGEVRYNKKFKPFVFSAGVSHLQGYTQNRYVGSEDVATEMRNGNTYLYAQIQGKLSKLNYIVGVGLSRQTYEQGDDDYKYWLFRPSLTLSYAPFNGASIRLQSNISPVTPSLSMLSDVTEQYNSLEYVVGNPNLRPYWETNTSLTLLYRRKRFYIQNSAGYIYSKNTIMGEINRKISENNDTYFEHSYKNQKSLSQFYNYLYGQFYVVPEKFTIQGGVSYLIYTSRGDNFTHPYHRWWGTIRANLTLNKWIINANWNAKETYYAGETVSFRSEYSNIYARYKLKDVTLGLDWTYIFTKNGYMSGDRTPGQFIDKDLTVFIPAWRNMVSVSLTWNFSKGRTYQKQQKTMNNSDSDSGILK